MTLVNTIWGMDATAKAVDLLRTVCIGGCSHRVKMEAEAMTKVVEEREQ